MSSLKEIVKPLGPPPLPIDAHKGFAGRVLCFAGSESMPGAAILAARAAHRAGAGLVTVAAFDREVMRVLPTSTPETIYLDLSDDSDLIASRMPKPVREHQHHVRVAGPGLGRAPRVRELVRQLTLDDGFDGATVLDADALNVVGTELESLANYPGSLVLTPHPGEAARLLGRDVKSDADYRVECAVEIARRANAICVLKGHETVVTDGESLFTNHSGNPGMATAGAGDVLAGILGAYLAHALRSKDDEYDDLDAVVSAVHVHGLAGDLAAVERGRLGLIASDLIEHLPAAQRTFEVAE